MSLFEDLVEELKEENLLEETVIEAKNEESGSSYVEEADEDFATAFSEEPSTNGNGSEQIDSDEVSALGEFDFELENIPEVDSVSDTSEVSVEMDSEEPAAATNRMSPLSGGQRTESGKEYFRRRATEEVKTLQMVDHIVTRVEKEQANINSAPFDDLRVKQSLHQFLQLDEEAGSSEMAEIEFLLLQETENWYTALTMRDKELSVENLRSYCEHAVPSLSTQALLALARFYRNAPFSELVRAKFDFIITKLYTDEIAEGKRKVSMSESALEEDIQELYKEWSSIPLYSADEGEEELQVGAMGFEDFMTEAKKAHSFDDLVSKDFFVRLNEFKEKANESFFAPAVVAAAIRCNVVVGNRYFELIENEHGGQRPEELTDKYGFLSDSAITEAIKKVFTAHEEDEADKLEARKKKARSAERLFDVEKVSSRSAEIARKKVEWYHANKKLVVITALTVVFGVFYFFFSSYLLPSDANLSSGEVQEMNLENSEFAKYVSSARINKNIAYAITNEDWKKLAKPEKEELMKRFLATGRNKGFSQINFLNSNGKKVAYVSAGKVEVD